MLPKTIKEKLSEKEKEAIEADLLAAEEETEETPKKVEKKNKKNK